jgi:hypothetical protein
VKEQQCRFDVTPDEDQIAYDRQTCDEPAVNLVDGEPRCEQHTPTIVKIRVRKVKRSPVSG